MYPIARGRTLFSAVCLFLLSVFLRPPAAEAFRGTPAPLNPAFLEYRRSLEKDRTQRPTVSEEPGAKSFKRGLRPDPVDFSYLKGAKVDATFFDSLTSRRSLSAATMPPQFDLVAEKRVTSVANQGGWGTCWAFAAMESVESSLLGDTGNAYDLSELNLAWFAYSDESPEKPAFTAYVDPASTTENPIFDNGGLIKQAVALFSRGTGPLYDSDAPYPNMDNDDPGWKTWVPNPLPYGPARFRMKQAMRFSSTDDIRRALMTIGGLAISFSVNEKYMGKDPATFYTPTESEISPDGWHAVMLVGWDDAFPKENFKNAAGVQPKADGAWKIQNSWGTDAGDSGYYWISYEDASLMGGGDDPAIAFVMEPLDSYDGIYFHDPLGECSLWELSEPPLETRIANVFTATRDEKIVGVSFMTANTNMMYAVQVFKKLNKNGDPGTGEAAFDAPLTARVGASGYYSVRLPEPVSLKKGERFAVAVALRMTPSSVPSDTLMLPVETAVEDYSEKATVNPGESWIQYSESDDWKDTFDPGDEDGSQPFNFCIKAFTVKRETSADSGGGCAAGGLGLTGLVLAAGLLNLRRKAA